MAWVAVKEPKRKSSDDLFICTKDLPKQFSSDSYIRVPRSKILTEDWFTLDEVDEILQISADAKKGIGISESMTADEFLNELQQIIDEDKKNQKV